MGSSSQNYTMSSSILSGTLNGAGQLIIASNSTTSGIIGASTAITSLTINSGATLTANESITATTTSVTGALNLATTKTLTSNLTLNSNATTTLSGSASIVGTVSLGSGSNLTVNSGTISGAVNGTSAGLGRITIADNFSLSNSFGATNSLALVAVNANKILTTGSNNITATSLTLGSESTLSLNGSTITSEISSGSNNATITKTSGTISGNINSTTGNLSITNTAGNITGNIATESGDLDLTLTLGNITGDIDLGTNASSTVQLNGGTIVGNITTGDANQTVTFNGGTLNGALLGIGKSIFASSVTLNANIGVSGTNVSSVNVTGTLNTGTYSIYADAITMADGSVLNIGSGTISSPIDGTLANKGTVNLNATNTINSTIGSNSDNSTNNGILALNISNGATITANNSIKAATVTVGSGSAASLTLATNKTLTGDLVLSANATTTLSGDAAVNGAITLGDNSTLNIGTGLVGAINGASSGNGTVNLIANRIFTTAIGDTVSIAALNTSSNTTITLDSNIAATNLTVGTSGILTLAGGRTLTGALTLSTNSTATLSGNAGVSGITNLASESSLTIGSGAIGNVIRGSSDGVGSLYIAATRTLNFNLGATSQKLALITINDGYTLTTGSQNIKATAIELGSGSSFNISSTSSTVSGIIRGSSDNKGTVNFLDNFTLGSSLGETSKSLNSITVEASKTLTSGSNNIKVSNLRLGTSSTLALSSGTVTGNVIGSSDGVGTITLANNFDMSGNFGSSSNSLAAVTAADGVTLTTSSDDIDATTINLGAASALAVTGDSMVVANISSGSNSATVTNNNTSGSITGNVSSTSGHLEFTNIAGNITGNISTTTGELDFTLTSGIIAGDITTTSGEADLIFNGGTLNGNVDLGSNIGSSLVLNINSIINGDITTASVEQTVTFNGGTLNGALLGAGRAIFGSSITLNANIGTSISSVDSVAVSGTLTTNQYDIYANTVVLENGSTFAINNDGAIVVASIVAGTNSATINKTGGLVTGNISSTSGNLTIINSSGDIDGNISTTSGNLSLSLTSGSTGDVSTLTGDADITLSGSAIIDGDVLLGNNAGSTITLGGTSLVDGDVIMNNSAQIVTYNGGNISGALNGAGQVIIADNTTLGGNIGSTTSVSSITINESKTLNTGAHNITASNVNIAADATLNVNYASTVASAINGASAGVGNLRFSGAGSIMQNSAIGASNKISRLIVSDNTTYTANSNINADRITIGDGVSGVLNLNSGTLGSSSSIIEIDNGAKFSYRGGVVNGVIKGVTSGRGTFEVAENYTNSTKIGLDNSISNLNILSEKTLTAGADIAANNIAIAGALNLGSTSRTITGNVSGSGAATINLDSAAHIIDGSLNLNSGDTLGLSVTSATSAGSVAVSGAVTNSSNANIAINITDFGYIVNGTQYVIVTGGSGSALNVINSANINVNNSGSNQYGKVLFTILAKDNNLVLNTSRLSGESVVSNQAAQVVYNTLNSAVNTSGSLRELQNYADSNASSAEVEKAVKQAAPQVDNSANGSAISVTTASMSSVENRLDSGREIGISSGDEISQNGLWVKMLNSSVKQSILRSGGEGYNSKSSGFSIGGDNVVNDTTIGFNLSYVVSNIKASTSPKTTNIDTYQVNFYTGNNFDKYFLDTIAGVAFNEYQSSRLIEVVNARANAKYSGKTYVAKARGGMINELSNGFRITPTIAITGTRNKVEKYSENGAGTLNLTVNNSATNFFEARAGLDFDYDIKAKDYAKITPSFHISYGHDFVGARQSTTSNFANQVTSFSLQGPKVYKNSIIAGFGLNVYKANGVKIGGEYMIEDKHNYQSHTALVKARYDF